MAWNLGSSPGKGIKRLLSAKDPYDITPITCDWHGVLKVIPSDTLTGTVTASIARNDDAPADLTLAAPIAVSTDGTQTTVWIAQGSIGFEYLVSLRASTTSSAQYERSFIIPVGQR